MKTKMFIDAAHPEETRVVVTGFESHAIQDIDFEYTSKRLLKGNIYLAKVVRVEPSLQAAFVEYSDSKHGFLPFSDIHPDYYQIPVADRKQIQQELQDAYKSPDLEDVDGADVNLDDHSLEASLTTVGAGSDNLDENLDVNVNVAISSDDESDEEKDEFDELTKSNISAFRRIKLYKNYKIQEVIKKNQVMLVQVTKEERGNKGAALTTYLSIAGRYSVLMPNAGRGGGVSRKIIDAGDRKRLKKIIQEIGVPEGTAIIVRTAGMERTKTEIRRDIDYLLKLWDDIRKEVLVSNAPKLIYEEANIIKRALRDMYNKNTEEVLIAGKEAYRTARDFIKRMLPSHARRIQLYKDPTVPLFHKYELEYQINNIFKSVVPMKSGGYLVINPTEALTAIDVNSGRSTKERHIQETALKTNLEAAEEVARQLRLRDLGGLVVIDFIDMEDQSHNQAVERKLRECLKQDRARIQTGKISNFGLLELSRQRLRPSLVEISTQQCDSCSGFGYVRTTGSAGLYALRSIETFLLRVDRRPKKMKVHVAPSSALYILNHKRDELRDLEDKYEITIILEGDEHIKIPEYKIEVLDHSNKKNEVQIPLKRDDNKPKLKQNSRNEKTPRKKVEAKKNNGPKDLSSGDIGSSGATLEVLSNESLKDTASKNTGNKRRRVRRRKNQLMRGDKEFTENKRAIKKEDAAEDKKNVNNNKKELKSSKFSPSQPDRAHSKESVNEKSNKVADKQKAKTSEETKPKKRWWQRLLES